jgi:hypothetical protein
MARSTFQGPILSGDNRFGPQRNVGSVNLVQSAILDFSVTSNATANYGGASGQFVVSNDIPNTNATIYVPQSGIFNASPTASVPTADATGTNYRGVVFYLPVGSYINDIFVDNIVQPTDGTHAVTGVQPYISNDFATSAGVYATSAAITGSTVGRTTCSFTASQYANAQSTLADVQNSNYPNVTDPAFFTQLVVTLKLTVASLTSVNAGKLAVIVQYTQPDTNIGNTTTYPYGNLD